MSNEVMLVAGLLDQAMATLAKAKTSAEILDAAGSAKIAFDTARHTAERFKNAHGDVVASCHKVMSDALQIEAAAQCRLADEVDAAQERGELIKATDAAINSHGGPACTQEQFDLVCTMLTTGHTNIEIDRAINVDRDTVRRIRANPGAYAAKLARYKKSPASYADVGLHRNQVSYARKVRDAEKAAPGLIKKTMEARLQTGKAPCRADITRAVKETLEKAEGDMSLKNPRPTPKPKPKHKKMIDLSDQGLPAKDIAVEVETCERQVHQILLRDRIGKEAEAKFEARIAELEALLDPSTLSKSSQERLEAFKRAYQKQLDNAFDARVRQGIADVVNDTVLPSYLKDQELYNAVIAAHKGMMTRETFRKILACLHPNSRRSASDEALAAAFNIIKKLEFQLVGAKEMERRDTDLPKTYDELMERKRQAQKAKRNGMQASA